MKKKKSWWLVVHVFLWVHANDRFWSGQETQMRIVPLRDTYELTLVSLP